MYLFVPIWSDSFSSFFFLNFFGNFVCSCLSLETSTEENMTKA